MSTRTLENYINGEFTNGSGDFIPVLNPATGETIAQAPETSLDDVNRAVDAAEAAQVDWAKLPAAERASYLYKIADKIRKNAKDLARQITEEQGKILELADGEVRVTGAPGLSISIREVAEAASGVPGYSLPGNIEPGMEASAHFTPTALTYSNGVHAVEVEVDVETGEVTIQRYVALSDSGRMINPMMVDGQIQGGVVHGIGNGLFEHMRYDELGQPLTTNLADYLLPTATELPNIDVIHHVSPSPLNPLGVKGVGECGTIPAAAAP